jgi:hypothetical protein
VTRALGAKESKDGLKEPIFEIFNELKAKGGKDNSNAGKFSSM